MKNREHEIGLTPLQLALLRKKVNRARRLKRLRKFLRIFGL